MQDSTESSVAGNGRVPPRKRRLRIVVLGIAALFLTGVWFSRYRGTGWTNFLNPVYWYHRSHGDDLYDASDAMLLHGNRSLPEVALTFDDGPHPESRGQILAILKSHHAHATFFDVGVNMALHPDLVQQTLEEGHEIGNHSENHNRLVGLSPRDRHREINDADITYCAITGKHLTLLRPPGMQYDDAVMDDTRRLGYVVVKYTTASRDFDPNEAADVIAERTLGHTENGSILLLHDYAATAAALPTILDGLEKRGFRFVTVSEMLAHLPPRPQTSALSFVKDHTD